jgi:predicted enzyme related to lactoylglutathione lyase
MQTKHALTILAVHDLYGMLHFYERAFGWVRTVSTDVYVEFELPGAQRIGLYERAGFSRNFGEALPETEAGGIRPFELYLYAVGLEDQVDSLTNAGARLLSPAAKREWGDEVAYFADPEGNVLAVARQPGVKKPAGEYTRDEFVRRVSDVVRRSGVDDAETLVRDLENAVHFPLQARCGVESALYGCRCVQLPGHEGYCRGPNGQSWHRM